VKGQLLEADVHEGEPPSRRDNGEAIMNGLVMLLEQKKTELITSNN